ncbi:hypothetical protein F3087_29350 [Nocardia colli]|uniref:Uncharacterized protein n=1 Tax=Nocardia colli TaxID=2545717 RepID=A0A5N0E9W1_9NOCA|nr:hypothetical protein [Nocardia colli]KAA8885736.1 hypothetical protein F3087_29350 [Nocardia colli]
MSSRISARPAELNERLMRDEVGPVFWTPIVRRDTRLRKESKNDRGRHATLSHTIALDLQRKGSSKRIPSMARTRKPATTGELRAGRVVVVVLFLPWVLLFLVVKWCVTHPEQVARAVNWVVGAMRGHPKVFAFASIASGAAAAVNNIALGNPWGVVIGSAWMVASVAWLAWLRSRDRAAATREIAARADAQHAAYLAGDDWGVYGYRDRPDG